MKDNFQPDIDELLRKAGLRMTRQRQAMAALLFDGIDKHMTAEQVHAALKKRRDDVSLATVYNTLHQFTAAGLLRQIVLDCARIYFDTNTHDHHHFYNERDNHLIDIPAQAVQIAKLPKTPQGTRLDGVDVIIRVRAED